jgi:hypothetical protein
MNRHHHNGSGLTGTMRAEDVEAARLAMAIIVVCAVLAVIFS